MTTQKQGALLDSKIIGVDVSSLHRTRRSKYRAQLRKALKSLPPWSDDCRWYVEKNLRGRLQFRHTSSRCWITANRVRYTEAVARNLTLGLWETVAEEDGRLLYKCCHGYEGSKKRAYGRPPKFSVMLGACPECLKLSSKPVFGTLSRKLPRWESGIDDPNAPCVFYVHQVSDGSYIYGVSAKVRVQHRMDQYKSDMGYPPTVVYQVEGTEKHLWYAEELLKKTITKSLDHDCEARHIAGGRTEYLPETYTLAHVTELVDEAIEITA